MTYYTRWNAAQEPRAVEGWRAVPFVSQGRRRRYIAGGLNLLEPVGNVDQVAEHREELMLFPLPTHLNVSKYCAQVLSVRRHGTFPLFEAATVYSKLVAVSNGSRELRSLQRVTQLLHAKFKTARAVPSDNSVGRAAYATGNPSTSIFRIEPPLHLFVRFKEFFLIRRWDHCADCTTGRSMQLHTIRTLIRDESFTCLLEFGQI